MGEFSSGWDQIAIMKALKHRNIVNLKQVLTSANKLYIVMDLVTGGELFTKILNEGKLEESLARRYFQVRGSFFQNLSLGLLVSRPEG